MKTRYVYYNKKTGYITDILDRRKRGRAPYIECSIDEVIGFLDGSKGLYQWIVAYNSQDDEHILIEKSNIIRMRQPSKNLFKIPYKKNAESDLRIVYYLDNILEVTLDVSRIAPLYQTNFRDEVVFERGSEIRLILKEKNSGNLLKEFIIEAQDLLDSVQLFFELYDHIYPDNVEFFTYKMFESYSWSKGDIRLMSPMKDRIKFEIQKADNKRRSTDFEYHLIMNPTAKGLKIKNNIENLKLIRFHKAIEFFVVDQHDPNILYEKFVLGRKDLEKSNIVLTLKTDARYKSILYNHKYISVLKEECDE